MSVKEERLENLSKAIKFTDNFIAELPKMFDCSRANMYAYKVLEELYREYGYISNMDD